MIQSILIPKNKFTISQAYKWIIENGYKIAFFNKPMHETDKYYRFRQLSPKNKDLKMKTLKNGIKLIISL